MCHPIAEVTSEKQACLAQVHPQLLGQQRPQLPLNLQQVAQQRAVPPGVSAAASSYLGSLGV